MRKQGANERFNVFHTDLRNLGATCEYGGLKDSLICDRIVCGIISPSVRAKQLNLIKAVDTYRAAEGTEYKRHLDTTVDRSGPRYSKESIVNNYSWRVSKHKQSGNHIIDCRYCGYEQQKGKCPAYGEQCRKCGKRNHYGRICQNTSSYWR